MVPWKGRGVLPYELAKMYNPKLPSTIIFKKFSPEKQDLLEDVQ
jgi:hypothetical protein